MCTVSSTQIDILSSDDEATLMNKETTNNSKTLEEFVKEAHLEISNGRLKLKRYRKVIKKLLFELAATINWLHADLECCRLNITPKSILIENGDIQNGKINSEISMVLSRSNSSETKLLNIYNKTEFNDPYAFDIFSFGIIIYYCFIGNYPTNDTNGNVYEAIVNKRLKQYLGMNNLLKFITPKILSFLNQLLNINETELLNSQSVIQHKYFKDLYQKYGKKKHSKSILKKQTELIRFADIFTTN